MHQQNSGIHRALKALVISTMMVLMPTIAHALEVGKLFVYSRLDAPLEAEIELLSVTDDEIDSLLPSVAPPAYFAGTELANQPEIKVTVTKRADGQYALRLSSEESLSEPILQFTLYTVWSGGHLAHDFSALVDPAKTVTNAATKQQHVPTGIDEAKPEFMPQPEQPAASAPAPDPAAPEPVSAPVVLSPPRVLIPIHPREQDGAPTTIGQSTATSPDKLDELGDSTDVVSPPVETKVVQEVAEPTIADTQQPLVQTQPQMPRDEPRALSPKAQTATVQRTRPVQQVPVAAAAKKQRMLDVATAFMREHTQWVLISVTVLVGGLILIAGGLIFVVVSLRRHKTTLEFQGKAPAAKVAVPTKAPEDEDHTDGNGRRVDTSNRRQGRRASNDRRKTSIPVAFDRRSGLSRRRCEILDGGLATVSSEALDPIAEADVYLSAGSYDHAEATLREALVTDPVRQDLKVKLLQVYQLQGDQLAFNTLAEELRKVLDGPSSELWKNLEANGWHPNGPADDVDAAQEEIVLEQLAEQERANGNAAPDVDTNTEKAEVELDSYTLEFEPPPQDHTVVNTLKDAFNEFLQARKGLKARTIDNYKQVMEASFVDWHKRTLSEISEDMVAERYQELWQEHGKAYANRAMRCLRTMYNFFSTHYRDASGKSLVPENPVKSLTNI